MPSKAHVYILTNESMPGLVKIGWTAGDPNERADALSTTGVPTRFTGSLQDRQGVRARALDTLALTDSISQEESALSERGRLR